MPSRQKPHYEGHRERLRDRVLTFGAGVLQDYEVLELLLTYAVPRRDMKPLAKELIETFGSFGAVVNASAEELMKVNGIKEGTAALLMAVKESAVRQFKTPLSDNPLIGNWDSLIAYCRTDMAQRKTEAVRVLFLDIKNRLIKDEIVQKGTINQAIVYPREIAKRALELSAASVIMVHNHPAGDLKPSKNDIIVTKDVYDALKTLNITLHDHLIVSKSGFTSFKACGYL